MNKEEWFKNKLASFKENFEFRLETFILDLTEKIFERMKKKKISRTKLAELLNVSRPAVTKILNGNSNFTLKTLLSLADALELDLKIDFIERDVISAGSHVTGFTFIPQGLIYDASTGSTAATIATASASITSPFPSREAEEGSLPRVVNA